MLLRRGFSWLTAKFAKMTCNFVLKVLASGPMPQHIAVIMDGNRRYARMNGKPVHEGHVDGFTNLRRILDVCCKLNVRCLSVYAFSIENFKRSEQEVSALQKLAEEKLLELCQDGGLLDQYDMRLNVVGRTRLMAEQVQAAIRKAEDKSRNNERSILNICMPYTSRDEMTLAVESCIQQSVEEKGKYSEILEGDIEAELMTSLGGSPPVDVVIRTSGVKRLSDFMLWQCCDDTQLEFISPNWPDFGFLDFLPIILNFQRKIWSKTVVQNSAT